MAWMRRLRWGRWGCWLALACAPAAIASSGPPSTPAPVASIPVEELGYRPPGPLYLLARYSSASLDYLDKTHLLFTFHVPRLLRRDQHAPGEDQTVHAVVLDLQSGKVTAETDWRLHDRRQYLWPLGDGKVLLRRGDDLFITDRTLALHSFLRASSTLRDVFVDPAGRIVVTETDLERHTPEEHEKLKMQADLLGEEGPAEDAQINMIEPQTGALKLSARANAPGIIRANAEGYVQRAEVSPNNWVLRFREFGNPASDEGRVLFQFNSTCAPSEVFLNESTLMVMTCSARTPNRLAQVVRLDGKFLWDGSWRSNLVWPTVETSAGGSDFAIGWIGVNRSIDTYDPVSDNEVQTQVVDVIDTHTGMLRLTIPILPVLSAGQNFALSPDGNELAVLNRGAIEVYPVPELRPPATTARR